MGFSLERFFAELLEILDSDISAGKKCMRIYKITIEAKKYAQECGMIRQ